MLGHSLLSEKFPLVAFWRLAMYARPSFSSSQMASIVAPVLDALYQVEQYGV